MNPDVHLGAFGVGIALGFRMWWVVKLGGVCGMGRAVIGSARLWGLDRCKKLLI